MIQELANTRLKVLLGPGADPALAPLSSIKIQPRVRLAHATWHLRNGLNIAINKPVMRGMLGHWAAGGPASKYIERLGLPRMAVEEMMGVDTLRLHLDPRKLIRTCVYGRRAHEKKPSTNAFIWDGDWDLCRADTRVDTHYRWFKDLEENRHQLDRTERYRDLIDALSRGRPYNSHNEGILLDSPERILRYLEIYLGFLDGIARDGIDPDRAKDEPGVAISRDGTIIKIRRGLHRHAMAQRVGLPSMPVRVRAVHRLWWEKVTDGARGAEALERVRAALPSCMPEQEAGPLDPAPSLDPALSATFWPAPRARQALQALPDHSGAVRLAGIAIRAPEQRKLRPAGAQASNG